MKILSYHKFNEAAELQKYTAILESSASPFPDRKFTPEKLSVISRAMAIKESIEATNIQSMSLVTESSFQGIGSVSNPAVVTAPNQGGQFSPSYQYGSGDMPQLRIAMAMDVIVETPGLELVPTIPIEFPQQRLAFFDAVYSGGVTGETTFDDLSYISFTAPSATSSDLRNNLVHLGTYVVTETGYSGDVRAISGRFIGLSRFDGRPILTLDSVGTITQSTNTYTASKLAGETLTSMVASWGGDVAIYPINTGTGVVSVSTATDVPLGDAKPELVSAIRDHIEGFNTRDKVSNVMDRQTGELSNMDKPISLRMWRADIEVGTIEVPVEVTRTQIQDYGRYGIDAMGTLMQVGRSQLSRTINKDITSQMFRLGVTTAAKLKKSSDTDLNLFIAPATVANKALSTFGIAEFKDIQGVDQSGLFTVLNSESNSAAENMETRQRRVVSAIRTACDYLAYISNAGRGNVAVVNVTVASMLRDARSIQTIANANTFKPDDSNLYYLGVLDETIQVYVDPLMTPKDTRICVGINKGERHAGLKFLPYDLVSSFTVQDYGTGNQKGVVTARYALAKTGFFPENSYLTFAINTAYARWS